MSYGASVMAKTTKRAKTSSPGSLKFSLKLDPTKVDRIQQCLKKGKLTITISRVSNIAKGENGYQYD
jgi:hypothetical protein